VNVLALMLLALAAAPDAGTPDPTVATPAKGSGPEKLPFTSDTIKEVVRAKQPQIERCWEQTLAAQDKPVEGTLKTQFIITPTGTVRQPKVVKKGTTLKDPALHRCVETVLSTMVFPVPPDGKDHPVEYPFNLKAVH
jgi:hypothetical protein